MFGPHSSGSASSVLANSHQLRSEFTFLLRALEGCASSAKKAASSDHSIRPQSHAKLVVAGGRTQSSAIFVYVLEVALALARFDVCLTAEERKYLVRAFDELVDGMTSSLRTIKKELETLEELNVFLQHVAQRSHVLDCVEWNALVARFLIEREREKQSAASPPGGNLPSASSPQDRHSSLADDQLTDSFSEEMAVPLSSVLQQAATSTPPVNMTHLYASILLFGTIEPLQNHSGGNAGGTLPEAARSEVPNSTLLSDTNTFATYSGFTVQHGSFSAHTTSNPLNGNTTSSNAGPSSADHHVVTVKYTQDAAVLLSPVAAATAASVFGLHPNRHLDRMAYVSVSNVSKNAGSASNTLQSSNSLAEVTEFCKTAITLSSVDPRAPPCTSDATNGAPAADTPKGQLAGTPSFSVQEEPPLFLTESAQQRDPSPQQSGGGTEIVRRNVSSTHMPNFSRTASSHNIETLSTTTCVSNKGKLLASTSTCASQDRSPVRAGGHLHASSFPRVPWTQEHLPGRPPSAQPANKTPTSTSKEFHTYSAVWDVTCAVLQKAFGAPKLPSLSTAAAALCRLNSTESSAVSPALRMDSVVSFSTDVVSSFAVGYEQAALRSVSQPILDAVATMLDAISAARNSLIAVRAQVRGELALLCFRVISAVIDLLLPAAECRGKQQTLFYRKWICDMHRVLLDEGLLRLFSAIVNRAKQTGFAESVAGPSASLNPLASSTPPPTPQRRRADESDDLDLQNRSFTTSADCLLDDVVLTPSVFGRFSNSVDAVVPDDPDAEPEDDSASAGALFRTFRKTSFYAARDHDTSEYAGCGGQRTHPGSGAAVEQHSATAAVQGLFRSLHGSHAVPPTGLLGTRLLFTLLNGTDVNSLDLREESEHSSSNKASPSLTAAQHPRTCSADDAHAGRPRALSQAPTSIVSPQKLPAAAPHTSHTKKMQSGTATIFAMPHHHRFRYPVVRNAQDVRNLYHAVFQEAEVALSVHDPLRAAIVMNYADFVAVGLHDAPAALDMIQSFLSTVEQEPIRHPSVKAIDTSVPGSIAGTVPSPATVGVTSPAPHSAFSVTSVRRLQQPAPSSAPGEHAFPPAATASSAIAGTLPSVHVQVPDVIPSWQNREEYTQFIAVLGLLQAACSALRSAGQTGQPPS